MPEVLNVRVVDEPELIVPSRVVRDEEALDLVEQLVVEVGEPLDLSVRSRSRRNRDVRPAESGWVMDFAMFDRPRKNGSSESRRSLAL